MDNEGKKIKKQKQGTKEKNEAITSITCNLWMWTNKWTTVNNKFRNFSIPEILAPLRAGTPNVFLPLKCCCWADTVVDEVDNDDKWPPPIPEGIGDVGLEYDVVVVVDVGNGCEDAVAGDDVVVVIVAVDDDDGGTSDRILSNDPDHQINQMNDWLIDWLIKRKKYTMIKKNLDRNIW